jgi:membrane dipeptidase
MHVPADERAAHETGLLRVGFLLMPQFTLLAFTSFVEVLRIEADERDGSRQIACRWWAVLSPDAPPIHATCGIEVRARFAAAAKQHPPSYRMRRPSGRRAVALVNQRVESPVDIETLARRLHLSLRQLDIASSGIPRSRPPRISARIKRRHPVNPWKISDRAAALLQDALVWDNTFPCTILCGSLPEHVQSLRRMKESGYNFVSLTISGDKFGIEFCVRRIGELLATFRPHADWLTVCYGVADIEAAKVAGKLGVGFHFQGTDPFGRDLGMVEVFYRLGVRHALLAYNQKNAVGDGCHERTDAGLSRYGLELIAEMNRVGMLVDCTHTGYRTTMEAMEASTAPCIFSHSSCRALCDHERNITDDQMKACARGGGVIGINGVGTFLGHDDASTENLIRHIDYAAQLVGPQHVGYGSDFVSSIPTLMGVVTANPSRYPAGQYQSSHIPFTEPEQMPELVDGLLKRGYSEADVRGIVGENWLRVCRQVWK